jgi:hypothetical protein
MPGHIRYKGRIFAIYFQGRYALEPYSRSCSDLIMSKPPDLRLCRTREVLRQYASGLTVQARLRQDIPRDSFASLRIAFVGHPSPLMGHRRAEPLGPRNVREDSALPPHQHDSFCRILGSKT